jgi:4-diphosphocytidyl-2C-methyl-D-erythritol kinase
MAARSYPQLLEMCSQVAEQGGPVLHLCGAGPALFTLPSSEEEHQRIAELLQPHGAGVYLVSTVPPEKCGLGSLPAGAR